MRRARVHACAEVTGACAEATGAYAEAKGVRGRFMGRFMLVDVFSDLWTQI